MLSAAVTQTCLHYENCRRKAAPSSTFISGRYGAVFGINDNINANAFRSCSFNSNTKIQPISSIIVYYNNDTGCEHSIALRYI